MIPNQPAGRVSPEVALVFRRLKQIPGDDCVCCLSLPLAGQEDRARPEFLVIYRQRNAFLLSVSPVSSEMAESVVQGSLFDTDELTPARFGLREKSVLEDFSRDVAQELGMADGPVDSLERVILFPHVPQALLDRIRQVHPSKGFEFWGKERLSTAALHARFAEAAAVEDGGALIQLLRRRFSPEIRVPTEMVARPKVSRKVGAALTEELLDLDQEMVVKLDLTLSPQAEEAVNSVRTRLITGVAGSGKSLVLLYRAMLLARLHPGARLLILTHNRPLNGDLRDRFARICPDASTEWGTFYQWCRRQMGGEWRDIVNPWERRDALDRILTDLDVRGLAREFLLEEIDWIKDQGIVNLRDYLAATRHGRGRALQENQRRAVFGVLRAYQNWLLAKNRDDWSNIPLRFLRLLDEGKLRVPNYDFVFIDEAQFFAPVWFKIVKRALRPEAGQLFMVADPTQGFLKRGASWARSGIDARGRTVRLQRSYRNTREILAFAARFYRTRLPDEEEEINLPEAADWGELPEGREPQFVELAANQDVLTRMANEIRDGIRNGITPGSMLVLADSSMVADLLHAINRDGNIAANVRDSFERTKVKVCSLDAGTGLEAPIVFLAGLDSVLEREEDLGLSEGERQERIRDNTRRIYMGMTRASQRLILFVRHRKTRAILEGACPVPVSPVR